MQSNSSVSDYQQTQYVWRANSPTSIFSEASKGLCEKENPC